MKWTAPKMLPPELAGRPIGLPAIDRIELSQKFGLREPALMRVRAAKLTDDLRRNVSAFEKKRPAILFKGLACTYGTVYRGCGNTSGGWDGRPFAFTRGCFARGVERRNVTFVSRHTDSFELADTANFNLGLDDRENGLYFAAVVRCVRGRDLRSDIRSATVRGCSLKFYVDAEHWQRIGGEDVRIIDAATLEHISAAVNPVGAGTWIETVES